MPLGHPTPAPDSPARQQAAKVKMVRYITISSGTALRLSEKWRHFACTSVIITFFLYISILCWRALGPEPPLASHPPARVAIARLHTPSPRVTPPA